MKQLNLRQLIFMALCCDLGLFAKKLILPAANLVTDALHIPGGIGTSFSLLFLVTAAFLLPGSFCATLMGTAQSLLALCFGTVGSMGALAPIGYIVPGAVIDLARQVWRRGWLRLEDGILLASVLASVSAAIAANAIVFRLRGPALWLYGAVAAASGGVCGILAASLTQRLRPIIVGGARYEKE